MSEEILRVPLEDLTTIRLICRCGLSVEMSVERLRAGTHQMKCPGCDTPLRPWDRSLSKAHDCFTELANAIAAAKNSQGARCEFIVPIKTGTGAGRDAAK